MRRKKCTYFSDMALMLNQTSYMKFSVQVLNKYTKKPSILFFKPCLQKFQKPENSAQPQPIQLTSELHRTFYR